MSSPGATSKRPSTIKCRKVSPRALFVCPSLDREDRRKPFAPPPALLPVLALPPPPPEGPSLSLLPRGSMTSRRSVERPSEARISPHTRDSSPKRSHTPLCSSTACASTAMTVRESRAPGSRESSAARRSAGGSAAKREGRERESLAGAAAGGAAGAAAGAAGAPACFGVAWERYAERGCSTFSASKSVVLEAMRAARSPPPKPSVSSWAMERTIEEMGRLLLPALPPPLPLPPRPREEKAEAREMARFLLVATSSTLWSCGEAALPVPAPAPAPPVRPCEDARAEDASAEPPPVFPAGARPLVVVVAPLGGLWNAATSFFPSACSTPSRPAGDGAPSPHPPTPWEKMVPFTLSAVVSASQWRPFVAAAFPPPTPPPMSGEDSAGRPPTKPLTPTFPAAATAAARAMRAHAALSLTPPRAVPSAQSLMPPRAPSLPAALTRSARNTRQARAATFPRRTRSTCPRRGRGKSPTHSSFRGRQRALCLRCSSARSPRAKAGPRRR